jgi:hypothetical protein
VIVAAFILVVKEGERESFVSLRVREGEREREGH